ncbi:glycosyltransferase family 4 protein [Photobacterium sp. 53610]|uniref:glycosyltransferase family 4 protein n=1 Tax=Photobacterium sp. 53610 TaxID=3102789 RepID=UPI002ED78F3F
MTVLLHVFSTFTLGGPQIRFAQLVNALPGHHQHVVISLDGRLDAAARLAAHVHVTCLTLPELKSFSLPERLTRIHRTLREYQPEVLMTYNWGAIEWALCNRFSRLCRGVHWEDGFNPDEATRLYPRRNLFRRLALGGRTEVVVPSHILMQIASQQWRIPPARLHYFPNGIETPAHLAPAFSVKQPTLITLASLRKEKNLPRLIDTVAAHAPDSRLLIGGDGPLLTELDSYVSKHHLNHQIRLAGRIDDVWGFLAQGDIFCLSSDTEQMPLSVLEAMGAGLPVLATDVGDVKSMLSAANQPFVVQPASYGRAMTQLLAAPDQWQPIGQANRLKVRQEYSFQTMLNNFCRLISPP